MTIRKWKTTLKVITVVVIVCIFSVLGAMKLIADINEEERNTAIIKTYETQEFIDNIIAMGGNVIIEEERTPLENSITVKYDDTGYEVSREDYRGDADVSTKRVPTWEGSVLAATKGVNYGPIGKETYYNLPMEGVISIMRNIGFSASEYPYWVREDGCKMLGDYIMVAADLEHFPRGSIVECSLGLALVCDTGGFIYMDGGWNWLDIATTW